MERYDFRFCPLPAGETTRTANHAAMRASRPGCGPRHVGDGRTPHMASKDDKLFSTGMASDLPDETAPPVKKAAAKRAPRKATKKASTPAHAPVLAPAEVAPVVSADVTADVTPDADEGKAPARKAAKRAPRKSTKKAAAALVDASVSVDATPAQVEVSPTVKAKKAPEIPGFGLLFQAPEPTADLDELGADGGRRRRQPRPGPRPDRPCPASSRHPSWWWPPRKPGRSRSTREPELQLAQWPDDGAVSYTHLRAHETD